MACLWKSTTAPKQALSDGANALPLRQFKDLVTHLRDLGKFVRRLKADPVE